MKENQNKNVGRGVVGIYEEKLTFLEEIAQLVIDMRLRGINTRYLLLLSTHINHSDNVKIILTEIVARHIKNQVREKWRLLGDKKKKIYSTPSTSLSLSNSCNLSVNQLADSSEFSSITSFHSLQSVHSLDSEQKEGEERQEDELDVQGHDDDRDYIVIVCEYFNSIFGSENMRFWETLEHQIEIQKFPMAGKSIKETRMHGSKSHTGEIQESNESNVNTSTESDALQENRGNGWKEMLEMSYLYERTIDLLGIEFTMKYNPSNSIETSNAADSNIPKHEKVKYKLKKDRKRPFDMSELEYELKGKIKHINRITFEEGTALTRLAMMLKNKEKEKCMKYIEEACKLYEECLFIKPNDSRAYYNWGYTLSLKASLLKYINHSDCAHFYNLAINKFKSALIINPNDCRAYFIWANTLLDQSKSTPSVHDRLSLIKDVCFISLSFFSLFLLPFFFSLRLLPFSPFLSFLFSFFLSFSSFFFSFPLLPFSSFFFLFSPFFLLFSPLFLFPFLLPLSSFFFPFLFSFFLFTLPLPSLSPYPPFLPLSLLFSSSLLYSFPSLVLFPSSHLPLPPSYSSQLLLILFLSSRAIHLYFLHSVPLPPHSFYLPPFPPFLSSHLGMRTLQ